MTCFDSAVAPRTLADLTRRGGGVRWSPARRPGFKEWFHFALSTADVDLLVNFSVTVEDIAGSPSPRARLVVLGSAGLGWNGGVVQAGAGFRCEAGDLSLVMGSDGFWFEDGVFQLSACVPEAEVDLLLRPLTLPALVRNVDLGAPEPLHWSICPRLVASGRCRLGEEQHSLRDVPAYHDHNWGAFVWGADFSWEWGFCLPDNLDCPWSVTFVRMRDRSRERVRTACVFLWKGAIQKRVFRGQAVKVTRSGLLRARGVPTFPRVMRLLVPGPATDVPQALEVSARRDGDELRIIFEPDSVARIAVPHDKAPGMTLIQEAAGRFAVEGTVDGERVTFSGRTTVEFLHG